MPSPFPGMDPYLEQPGKFPGFHSDLHTEIKRMLRPQLGGKYDADTEVMLYIHEPSAQRRGFGRADDAVSLTSGGGNAAAATATAVEPSLRMDFGERVWTEKHRYVEIRTTADDRLVTVIEVLSPTNKHRREGRAAYLAKRRELMDAGVHVLQIDLLRRGPRLLPQDAPPHHYNAMLARDGDDAADVWFWSVRDPLPRLPVPLLDPDPDVVLDLQAAFDRVYDLGYGPSLYRHPIDPPLAGEDAAWADGLLNGAR